MARPTLAQLRVLKDLSVYPDAAEMLGIMVSGENPDGTSFSLPVDAAPSGADRHDSIESAANAAAVITWGAEAAKSHNISAIEASFSVAATMLMLVEEAAVVRARIEVASRIDLQYGVPLKFLVNTPVTVRLPAGGVGSIGRLSVHGFTR